MKCIDLNASLFKTFKKYQNKNGLSSIKFSCFLIYSKFLVHKPYGKCTYEEKTFKLNV